MRTLLTAGLVVVFAGLSATATLAAVKSTNTACGRAMRTDMCKMRSFDPKPDTKTPIPYELGSGKKDG
jgi:hypothetical protein